MTSYGNCCIVEVQRVELNHLVMYSQFFSSKCVGTGLQPTIDFAVLDITEDAPVFEKALPGNPDSQSLVASYSSIIGLPSSVISVISSEFLYIKLYTVNKELSVVPEIGIGNLVPSSSQKSTNVVKESGFLLTNVASTFSFCLVTPRFLPSGKLRVIGNFPTSEAILGRSSKFSQPL